jgi:hypothetical protein
VALFFEIRKAKNLSAPAKPGGADFSIGLS